MESVKRITVFLTFFIFVFQPGYSQQVPIGQWRDELPFNQVISVTEGGSRIYCATPHAIFYYNKDDNTVVRLTKINGLSDIGISSINYSTVSKTLVVAYTNANIDLIKNNTIINISDIKRKSILGNKTINRINFIGPYAYLSCGFGIVVLDVDKEEIHDTYYIGRGGDRVNVFGLVKNNDDTLFAATGKGIYKAYYNDPNLVDYSRWHKDPGIDTNAYFNAITFFSGEVVVGRAILSSQLVITSDTLYRFSNSHWNRWALDSYNPVMNLESTYQYLCVTYNYSVNLYDTAFNFNERIFGYPEAPFSLDAIVDKDRTLWIGDTYVGLVSHVLGTQSYNKINLGGPLSDRAFSMTTNGNDLYIAPGGMSSGFVPFSSAGEIYHFDSEKWLNISSGNNPDLANIHDIVTIAIDPSDNKHMFAGSFGGGLIEFYDGVFKTRYNQSNSTLHHHSLSSDPNDIRVGGAAFDKNGNLWVVNSHNDSCISKKSGNQWTGYYIPLPNPADLGQLLVDRNNQKWILMRFEDLNSYSVMVFTEDGNKYIRLNSSVGNGNIPGDNVFAIAEDLNGEIWVGTEQGVGVFYSPENIFVPGANFDAQQILVQQGTYTQYLLENETVTAIAVDGGNNKWIGTDRGGLFEFSPDGTKQLNHFTQDDSPLFSDRITSIAIAQSGEVFVGTDQGVISYRGSATPAQNTETAYAFPNPVKKDYTGLIAITGLVGNASVKITDVNGTLVYATTAEGGQAIWDGKNFAGRKAQTGVYLVFASTTTGSEKVVTKILIIN